MSLIIEKIPKYFWYHYSRNNLIGRCRYACFGQKILKIRLVTMYVVSLSRPPRWKNSAFEKKSWKILTGDSELNLFRDDGSNAVFGIASIVSCVRSADWLYFVEMFGRKIWQKDAIFHPTILHLRKTCKKAIKTLTICAQFMTSFDKTPKWMVVLKLDISDLYSSLEWEIMTIFYFHFSPVLCIWLS